MGTYGERCSNVHLSLQKANFLFTRFRPRPSRFRYRTGPRVLDGGALWLRTERAPWRPEKGQRWQRWVRGQWLLPSSKDSTPESPATAASFSCRLLMTSCSSEPELLCRQTEEQWDSCKHLGKRSFKQAERRSVPQNTCGVMERERERKGRNEWMRTKVRTWAWHQDQTL